jgi:hypothetical protein
MTGWGLANRRHARAFGRFDRFTGAIDRLRRPILTPRILLDGGAWCEEDGRIASGHDGVDGPRRHRLCQNGEC